MHPRSPKKKVGSHKLDVDVAMGAAGFFFGADNTTLKVTFESNFFTGPQNCVFQNRSSSNSTIPPDDCPAPHLRAWIANCGFMDRQWPARRLHGERVPSLGRNRAVY